MADSLLLFLLLTLSVASLSVNGHNITDILAGFPEYSLYNSYLTQTKLADEINSRQTITCLVLNNAAMSAVAGKHPLSVIKSILSYHVILDYYDSQKLHQISNGTTVTTTLYQTTGNAPGNSGFVNITDLQGGKVGFGPATPGVKLGSSFTKSVKQIRYNISVLEISDPILAPGILTAPAPSASDVNITALLEKAGCKTFASLLASSGVLKTYQSAIDKGLTIFAPNDEAFKARGVPDLSKLTNADLDSLLKYHAAAEYIPKGSLKTTRDSIATLASNGAEKFDLSVTSQGDDVTLHTGVGSSRLADTVLDSTPVVIFTVDNLLLPTELFGKSPSPAPAPEPTGAPSPTPVTSPSPSPESDAPSPVGASPPAPPAETPGEAPADAPAGSSENTSADKSGSNNHGSACAALTVVVLTVLSSILLC